MILQTHWAKHYLFTPLVFLIKMSVLQHGQLIAFFKRLTAFQVDCSDITFLKAVFLVQSICDIHHWSILTYMWFYRPLDQPSYTAEIQAFHLRFLIFQGHITGQDVGIFHSFLHVWVPGSMIQHQTSDQSEGIKEDIHGSSPKTMNITP